MGGWVVAHDGNVSVALDPTLDAELISEGEALELIRAINELRKQEGLDLTDRIAVRLPGRLADLVDAHGDWIASEVLATSVDLDDELSEPAITRDGDFDG